MLVASTPDSGDRDRLVGARGGGDLRRALGDLAFVSQPEALVGRGQSVAAVEGCPGTVDADSLRGLCLDAIARPAAVAVLSTDGDCALAKGCDDHCGAFLPVTAHAIYRTSRARRLRPEVRSIRDAFPRAGSAFAVLRRLAQRRSALKDAIVVPVIDRLRGNPGRRDPRVSKLQ